MKTVQVQFKTNAKRFGDSFGVYNTETKQFEKQNEYSQCAIDMPLVDAMKLKKELQNDARGCKITMMFIK